jgi:glycyl-tRNA synthetase alpha chain
VYSFELADTEMLSKVFDSYEAECKRTLERGLLRPAYDYVLKCSHLFNLLDSRGAVSVAQRNVYLGRCRNLSRACARMYLEQREELGHPLLGTQDEVKPA